MKRNMTDLRSYKSKLSELSGLIDKLEKGELTIEELSLMERLTRELHERSIILRYKAFEQKAGVEVSEEVKEEIPEPVVVPAPDPEPDEEPAIEFSIFDEEDSEEVSVIEEESVEPISEETDDEPEVEEHTSISKTEERTEDTIETTVEVKHTKIEERSFADRLNLGDNSLASQFSGGKLDSLVGAFGLNQRLRFINNLFDGSSEQFSEAVKVLDSQPSLEDATAKIEVFANEHDWDPEEENVIEFMTFVNRRYA